MNIVLATRNRDKIREIAKILDGLMVEISSALDFSGLEEVEEDGVTLEENAAKKAIVANKFTNKLAIADDSGLEVDSLEGRPGVYSARFAGEGATYDNNNKKLLKLMEYVPPKNRTARFVCVVAIADEGKIKKIIRGTCEGIIAFEPKGKTGFGYDPLFIIPEYNKTFAELGPEIKNKISHRAKAFLETKKFLVEMYSENGINVLEKIFKAF
ncbi:XTP/dITP diphosphatase [bacterium]|nr:XTP/dITP diphosphatase [bacterium]